MPLAAFPGRWGWGYDGVHPYAVHDPYGGPEALQRFVDAAHGLGLGVCLDVVYNHLGPAGNYLSRFGPYFTEKHHTPWGQAVNLDDTGGSVVRRWIVDNALRWFRDFHVDALRLDAVHEPARRLPVHLLAQPERRDGRAVGRAPPAAHAHRRERPERPGHGRAHLRRRPRHERAVERRPAPRAARHPHR
ncbi:hypothetical protein GCM10025868_04780 [Angustibacter aerolatus]|uniref:Glycosyl hydrolase family 13 catalytic domain-containing protein n=1 Tax=Angustibacter aerolatus TaxID=1162965 RepID=A0ABQ6JAM5_9ACTN|nr:alpha-amylase family glycosyl hydrolase [Angustibacter aerolatus]GMA85228.1 hypothetical protein GCM10025868_04780 [Angustibacter aerolatus]